MARTGFKQARQYLRPLGNLEATCYPALQRPLSRAELFPLQSRMSNPIPRQAPENVTMLGNRAPEELIKVRSHGWALVQHDLCPQEERRTGRAQQRENPAPGSSRARSLTQTSRLSPTEDSAPPAVRVLAPGGDQPRYPGPTEPKPSLKVGFRTTF